MYIMQHFLILYHARQIHNLYMYCQFTHFCLPICLLRIAHGSYMYNSKNYWGHLLTNWIWNSVLENWLAWNFNATALLHLNFYHVYTSSYMYLPNICICAYDDSFNSCLNINFNYCTIHVIHMYMYMHSSW